MAASRPAAAVAVSILQPTYSETDYASFFAHRHEKKNLSSSKSQTIRKRRIFRRRNLKLSREKNTTFASLKIWPQFGENFCVYGLLRRTSEFKNANFKTPTKIRFNKTRISTNLTISKIAKVVPHSVQFKNECHI